MKPPPPRWPRMSASIQYDDPLAALDWLVRAFGFEVPEGHLWWFILRIR